ncbi:MAG TPA: primosomal replication protein N [Burkholderiales bacterium]|nr:primosomal replication protein N [Burkholderiales bacterium]
MKRNQVDLDARLVSSDALRHTPAGIPILSFRVAHRSEQLEAGRPRSVEFEMECVAVGPIAERIAQVGPGRELALSGFLARRNRFSHQTVLYTNDFALK